MKQAKFFDKIRAPLFGGSLSQDQVDGIEMILSECAKQGASLTQTAYILATAYGESGGAMQPKRENMNYSAKRLAECFGSERRQGRSAQSLAHNPRLLALTVYGGEWGLKNLGNRIGTTDGWDMRGAGIGQITGYANFLKWGKLLGVDLIANPHLLEDLKISVRALVAPMLEGWATSYKLSDFINSKKTDYIGARKVWNGSFKAKEYAGNAKLFEAALTDAGWQLAPAEPEPAQPAPAAPAPVATPATPAKKTWWGELLSLFGL